MEQQPVIALHQCGLFAGYFTTGVGKFSLETRILLHPRQNIGTISLKLLE
jgi:hypothetical protein